MVELNEEQADLFGHWLSDDEIARMSAATLELVFCATETIYPHLTEETVASIQARAAELLSETTSLQDLGYLRYWIDISKRFEACLRTETRFDRIASSLSWIDDDVEGEVYARVRELAEAMPFPELAAEFDCLCTLSESRSLVVTTLGEVMRSRAQSIEELLAALYTTSDVRITAPLIERLEGLIVSGIVGGEISPPSA